MTKFSRRQIAIAATSAASAGLAAPAIAQTNPSFRWRMPMFVPRSVDVLWKEAADFTRRVSEATEGRFTIQIFAPGEIVPPGPAMLDAVENGTIECANTLSYYSVGKDPTYTFGTSIPFGMNTRLQQSWYLRGGGAELCAEFFATKNLHALVIGNSTAQMGGWFRKEIKSLEDLKGLKMRIPGLGGRIMAALGVVPQQLPPGDIYSALERGTIDAAEFAAPYDDEKFGFARVAPFYYSPGWWEPNAMTHVFVNLAKWNELPKHYQTIMDSAAAASNQNVLAHFDSVHSAALRRLLASGVQLRVFPNDVMTAAYDTALKIFDEIAASNPAFAKIYQHHKKFMEQNELYPRVADNVYDNFVYSRRVKI